MQKIDLHQDLITSFENNILSFDKKIESTKRGDTHAGGLPNYQEADLQIIRSSIRPYIVETNPENNQKQIKYSNKELIYKRQKYEELRRKFNIFLIQDSNTLENTKYIDFRLNLVYHLKGADGITTIEDLQKLQKAGIRSIQPVREFNNPIAHCHRSTSGGITEFGKEALDFMDQNKIIIDTANMNYQSMIDTYKFTKKPIMNSHTNIKSLHESSRNIGDDFLDLIEKSEGLIGLTLTSSTITDDQTDATIEDFIKQIKYVKNRIGEDHIGLGTGYHGLYYKKLVTGLENISQLNILEQKVIENFGYKFATKFFRENAYKFLMHTI